MPGLSARHILAQFRHMTLRTPLVTLLLSALLIAGCSRDGSEPAASSTHAPATKRFCKPGESCWPTPADWEELKERMGGRLLDAQSPLEPCRSDTASQACADAMELLRNPFAIADHPGGTQSLGWLGAWNAESSAYAVAAQSAVDIAAAVEFAREHRLRVVIKATGHDYLGRSNAPDSLLIWTRNMRGITTHDAFVPLNCAQPGVPAVTVEAGTRWLDAYQEVTVKQGRYVQGGGCTSVGAAGGFVQGGGFGSWSKKYGSAAAGMLQAEVVTADGKVLVANACQNQDLFWALRGGGGGTYGVVTNVTLMTHPLPTHLGFVIGRVQAKSDAAFKELLEHFLRFYRERLHNENWGEQARVRGDNTLELSMSFHDLSADEARAVWRPFVSQLAEQPNRFAVALDYLAVPAQKMWDLRFIKEQQPSIIQEDLRPQRAEDRFWWASDQEQVATYWYAYQSRWIPAALFQGARIKTLAATLFDASRQWSVTFHFNKGQAGAATEAVRRGRETSINPAVYDAAALMIIAANGTGYPGVSGHEPDLREAQAARARVSAAMQIIRELTPGAGAYVNEADYFEPDWQRSFWGEHYDRLVQIKRKYDPDGLFVCHHCVGSE